MSIHPAVKYWREIEVAKMKDVLRNVVLPDPILDLGCGDGKIARQVFDKHDIVGIDLLPTSHGIVMDARNLDFSDNSFGTIFSNCVLEHIPEIEKVLIGVYRVLKSKGYFIFTVPTEKFKDNLLFSWVPGYGYLRNKHLSHYHCVSSWSWNLLLRKIGFRNISMHQYMTPKQTVCWDKLCWAHKLRLESFLRVAREPSLVSQDSPDFGSARLVVAQKL
jgi:ubiquinone/menaquinone biosynthesis C-methylase UbiE